MEPTEISEEEMEKAAHAGDAKALGAMARALGPERLRERRFQSAGQIAIEGDWPEFLEALLDAGWAPGMRSWGKQATHLAARSEALGCLRVLLDRGFSASERGEHGESPAHWAAGAGALACLRELLSRGADPNARDASGATPGHDAARTGQAESLRVLLEFGWDPETMELAGTSPLRIAREWKRAECAKFLERAIEAKRERGKLEESSAAGGTAGKTPRGM